MQRFLSIDSYSVNGYWYAETQQRVWETAAAAAAERRSGVRRYEAANSGGAWRRSAGMRPKARLEITV